MDTSSQAKERILGKIKAGLERYRATMPFAEVEGNTSDIYARQDMPAEEIFASEFIKLGGKFVFCDTEQELVENMHALYDSMEWQELLCTDSNMLRILNEGGLEYIKPADAANESADACITPCEALVARTGSILISSKQNLGRIGPVFYPVHIIVAYASQVVADIDKAFESLKLKYGSELPSMINLNTGPSRTADIEKTLVVGVHGPKEVFCFLINA